MPDSTPGQDVQDKAASEVTFIQEGPDRYRVFTPHYFNDGDGLVIVLKKDSSSWVLSDEGHTAPCR